jgi:hypothetical protein
LRSNSPSPERIAWLSVKSFIKRGGTSRSYL